MIGLTPAGPIADARDTYAAGRNLWKKPSWMALGGVGLAAIGWLPVIGDWLKGTARSCLKKEGKLVAKECEEIAKNGTIYKVPGKGTKSGKPYIGRHNKPDPAKTRRSSDGRDRSQAEVIDKYDADDVMQGRVKEQDAIDQHGGIENLDNQRNEIARPNGG